MNEYLAPGVYVEEVSFRAHVIEPVDPSVTALVGTATEGPVDDAVELSTAAEAASTFGTGSWLAQASADFLAAGGRSVAAVRASAPAAGLAALAGSEVRLLVVEHDLPAAYLWAVQRRAFLVVDAAPGGVLPTGLGRDAAAYYPRLVDVSGATRPCAPAVAGVIARSDRERGAWKAPAGTGATLPASPSERLSRSAVELLTSRGVNALRVVDGRTVVWGARTAAWQDPEWRYVPVRRTVLMLEASLDRGLQWAVFEPNAPALWVQVRDRVEDFLTQLWRDGALMGTTPDEAFFVRCDASTMTQADLDDGRLVCLVGVALLRPAEFVVLRVVQRTAETV